MSQFYDSENYDLSSGYETNEIMADLPFDLIQETINEQIKNPISISINYIDTITDRVAVFKEIYGADETVANDIQLALNDFFTNILTSIDRRFGLELDIEKLEEENSLEETAEALYKYFVLRYAKNINKMVRKYISLHKKEISNFYNDKNKKDVSTIVYKKQIKNPEDLLIIANLSAIIKYILELDMGPMEFVTLSCGDGNYEGAIIKDLITRGIMLGDFVDKYIAYCVDEHYGVIDELYVSIKQKYIEKNI